MNRTKLIVRLFGVGEAHAEGIVAIMLLALVAALWIVILGQWDDGLLALVQHSVGSVLALIQAMLNR